jgi:hypothetical protein
VKTIILFLVGCIVALGLSAETVTQNAVGYQANPNIAVSKVVKQSGANILNAVDSDDRFKVLNVKQVAKGAQANVNLAGGKNVKQAGVNVGNSIDMTKTSQKVNTIQVSDVYQRNINASRAKNIKQSGANIANTATIKSNGGVTAQYGNIQQANVNYAQGQGIVKQAGVNVGNSVSFK